MVNKVYTKTVAKSSPTCPYPPKTPQALEWSLGHMTREVQFNLRSHDTEWRQGWHSESGEVWDAWETMTTRAAAHIRSEILRYYNLTFSQVVFADCLEALLYSRETDPLKDYLEGLPKPQGRNILPYALATCMNVTDGYEELARWASVYMFLGVVWRCYEPGTKLDEIPILVGPGGIGKSTLPALAVPQDIPRLYGSGLELNGTTQRMVESILGRAIVEIDEMAGVNAGDMSRIKAFLSRLSDDGTRLAFKHTTEPLPRRCVMLGTADRDQFLPYDPNLRRFVPILLNKGDVRRVRTYMAKYRDRLWAEAVVLYRDRVPAHLPPKLKERAEVAVREAVK